MASPARSYRGVSAEQRRADRRVRLIEAGLELLGERGWAGTSVRAVCAQAQLTERYFYESFRDRDELAVAIFDRCTSEAAAGVVAAAEAAPHDARAKTRAAIDAFVGMLSDDPRLARTILVESLASEALRKRREAALGQFAGLISFQGRAFYGERAVSAEDANLTALALVGALAELLMRWTDDSLDVSRERLVNHCTELFVSAAEVSSGG